jgi:hypothetical protein
MMIVVVCYEVHQLIKNLTVTILSYVIIFSMLKLVFVIFVYVYYYIGPLSRYEIARLNIS